MKPPGPLPRTTGLRPGVGPQAQAWKRRPFRESDGRKACRRAVIARDGKVCAYPGCGRTKALELHEVKFRSRGGSPEDPDNCRLLCHQHNGWVHDNPDEARRLGLAVHGWETVALDNPGLLR